MLAHVSMSLGKYFSILFGNFQLSCTFDLSIRKHIHKHMQQKQGKVTKQDKKAKRSVRLASTDFTAFKKWVRGCDTKTEAADKLGVSRMTLDNIILKGTGHPETINKIVELLESVAA